MRTVEYAPGRLADLFGDSTQPTILLWHGQQTDARAAVRPLAGLLAGHDAAVVVPDWDSYAQDGGRADLLRSIDFTRERANDADGIVLVGWSLGGVAAARLTLDAAQLDIALAHTVCLACPFTVRDPISGRLVTEGLSSDHIGSPFTLMHGLADDVVPVTVSRLFAASLERIGWPVDLLELAADHWSIAGTEYDAVAERYEPGKGGQAQFVAGEVAARIAATLGR
ncbi:MAG TPA: alpha/beta fold hydrolase [Mycobacterium sp.]|nr:alpha/beta fold hydrolase [Mycobacterium sp.]HKI41482.1 alpha/beta fold hydrolase [Mycobacterium sp.]